MHKIVPCIWMNGNAEEAVELYTSLFEGSSVKRVVHYGDTSARMSGQPEGSVMTILFTLGELEYMALNGGPSIQCSPSISFFVNCDTKEELDRVFAALSEGGMVLMELGEYPFSQRFGWLNDKFGVSWQVNLASRHQKITPFLMFSGAVAGRAEEAMEFYRSCFNGTEIVHVEKYKSGEFGTEGTIKMGAFKLEGQEFMVSDSAVDHKFGFTPGISFMVNCRDQAEIDHMWSILSVGGSEDHCGWLTDRYGVSWQIVPDRLGEMLSESEGDGAERIMKAIMGMKKLDLAELQAASSSK